MQQDTYLYRITYTFTLPNLARPWHWQTNVRFQDAAAFVNDVKSAINNARHPPFFSAPQECDVLKIELCVSRVHGIWQQIFIRQ